jgi:TatD DNase family protein
MLLVDSHCHLDQLDLTNYEHNLAHALSAAKEQGVGYILNVCITLDDFPKVLQIAHSYPNIGASVGLHPNEKGETNAEQLVKLGQANKVIAIGETGLDYYRSEGDLAWQKKRFREHIRAAKTLCKPLIIHTRQAKADTIQIMQEEGANEVGGVMHCFTEDWAMAELALDLGFYISFSGIVTFANAKSIQEVAQRVPLERMLIETDAPYLAPIPHRGKSNEPAYVRYTAEYLAKLRAIPLEQFAEQTTENFFTLFKNAERLHV